MQELTQPQVNRLRELLAYAKTHVLNPEDPYYQVPFVGDTAYPPRPSTVEAILDQANRRVEHIRGYQAFRQDIDEYLNLLDAFEYPTYMDGTIYTAEPRTAPLGDLLNNPDKYSHLGNRDIQESNS
jgi:hypothetical protein